MVCAPQWSFITHNEDPYGAYPIHIPELYYAIMLERGKNA